MTGHGQRAAGVLTRRLRPVRRLYPAPPAVPPRLGARQFNPFRAPPLMAAI